MSTTFCCTEKEIKKKKLEKADLQCAVISLIIIDMHTQNNNIRSLRVQSSDDQRLCHTLITRVTEWCAISTDWISLHYEALINFSSSVRVTVSSIWQCVTESFSYHMLTMMNLLHMSWQWDIIMTSHRTDILCIRDITLRQTSDSLQVLSRYIHYSVSLSLFEGVDHYELIC